ncbi:hypothetical protein O9H85_37105 [Paenibacillus filicis]|uniref:Uncharacterized protein n=1 Tax=Paenibacillus gyeongsangnamensis TaxID=3388067 RepID=A0ABT4QLX0_9BACL|nr:hypothetical protein [Paenibacillus filicis]MCZ8517807.1 hypothetical protein [Paenibacillus filicis]
MSIINKNKLIIALMLTVVSVLIPMESFAATAPKAGVIKPYIDETDLVGQQNKTFDNSYDLN